MSWWIIALLVVAIWMCASVLFSLCFSVAIQAGDMRFVDASVLRVNSERRNVAGLPMWIMPDCECQRCVEKRTAAQNARSMEHAYDRAMRDAFEKQED